MINIASLIYINETHLSLKIWWVLGASVHCSCALLQGNALGGPMNDQLTLEHKGQPSCLEWWQPHGWISPQRPWPQGQAKSRLHPRLNPCLTLSQPGLLPSLTSAPSWVHTFYKAWALNLWPCFQVWLLGKIRQTFSSKMSLGGFLKDVTSFSVQKEELVAMTSYKPTNQRLWAQVIDSECFSASLFNSFILTRNEHASYISPPPVRGGLSSSKTVFEIQDREKESFNPPWQHGAWHITGTKNSFLDELIHP